MIKVSSKVSLPVIEELYTALYKQAQQEGSIDVYLPTRFDPMDFSVLFSFLQFIATWVRHSKSGALHLPIDSPYEAAEYLENDPIYPSIALAWEKGIHDRNGTNIKHDLKKVSQEYFKRMELFAATKGQTVPIYCFDHDKRKSGHSKTFYSANQELYPEFILGTNLLPALKKIGNFNPDVFKNSVSRHSEDFFAIIHELFGNTHEHAKTSAQGHNLYPNIRAIYLRFHKRKLESYQQRFSDHPGLAQYFASKFCLNTLSELYLMEISILDSGPGLVKRYLKKETPEISVEEEVTFIKKCLYRHNTSSSPLQSGSTGTKGLGLDRVLQTINQKGFVRIRTGRADIFRDMRNNVYHHHAGPEEIMLQDWHTNSSTEFTQNLRAEGTLISIFYPLDYVPY